MPDDDEKKVAESEEEEVDEFSAVFAEEDEKEEAGEKKETKDKKPEEPDKDKDEKEEKAKAEAEAKAKAEKEEKKEEEDELVTRGKEVLDAEEKQRKEKEQAEEKAKEQAAKEAAAKDATTPINETDITNLMGIVDKKDIPNKDFEIDGVTVNPGEFASENPEALVIGGLMAAKTVNRMIKTGALVSGQTLEQKLQEHQDLIWGNTFSAFVTMWHSDAEKIVQDKAYTKWLDGQKDEVKALVKTGNPLDLIDVINRYKEGTILSKEEGKGKKAAEEKAEAEAKAKKEKADKLLKKAKKKTPTIPGLSDMEDVDDDFSGGFNEEEKK